MSSGLLKSIISKMFRNHIFDIYMEKIFKNKMIQSEEFNKKERQRYNIWFSINYHQDSEKMLWSVVITSFLSPDDGIKHINMHP